MLWTLYMYVIQVKEFYNLMIGSYNCLYVIQGMTEDPCWRWLFPVQTSSPPTQRSPSVWWGCPLPWRTPATWLTGLESNRSAHFCWKQFVFFCLYVIVNNICSCNVKQYESFSMIKITICIELRYYIKSRILHQPKLSCE